jgi:hypothetical protein
MMPHQAVMREPRAALFLNRYTRTQLIMYATGGLAEVLGITGEDLRGKSFYYCIHRNCLRDAIRCLENAKANDSIAYLRFWWRDPREDGVDEEVEQAVEDSSEDSDIASPSQSEPSPSQSLSPEFTRQQPAPATATAPPHLRASSSSGLENHPNSHEGIFVQAQTLLDLLGVSHAVHLSLLSLRRLFLALPMAWSCVCEGRRL